jgi:hypothetical protein
MVTVASTARNGSGSTGYVHLGLPRAALVGGLVIFLRCVFERHSRIRTTAQGTVVACSGLSMQVALFSRITPRRKLRWRVGHKGAPSPRTATGLSLVTVERPVSFVR